MYFWSIGLAGNKKKKPKTIFFFQIFFYLITKFSLHCLKIPTLNLCVTPVKSASKDLLGGRQCFLPSSWQHTFGKQSKVLLHAFGYWSNTFGGGGVHCRYPAIDSKAESLRKII